MHTIATMNHLMRVTSKVGTASKAMTVKTMREIVHLGLGTSSVIGTVYTVLW